MNLTLHIWRQKNAQTKGKMIRYEARDINSDMSFLEMLDVVNWALIEKGEEPIAFDHDCREGICGSCGMMINGVAHGPQRGTAACQLHMRHFKDGETIFIEPWRSKAFPVIKDLVVDRSAFDRIIQAGGYISVRSGAAPEASTILIRKEVAELAMDAAACIGCGACVAACPNGSASLFTSAKIAHLNLLPQGKPEQKQRVLRMVQVMDEEGFGNCTMHRECEAVCPKEISVNFIARMNREYLVNSLVSP
ncbi:MAG TPA: succinate dehydrogenase/fumarate reductase iron-sulfur subunit [Pyrinomonadaceae bacterium]|nr:succinate dehydrogenase/fumarate reductase iron-sulfur subunit [Pyrinomonadaceae bacterium]